MNIDVLITNLPIIIVATASLLVALIVIRLTRSMMGKDSSPKQEQKPAQKPKRSIISRLVRRSRSNPKPKIGSDAELSLAASDTGPPLQGSLEPDVNEFGLPVPQGLDSSDGSDMADPPKLDALPGLPPVLESDAESLPPAPQGLDEAAPASLEDEVSLPGTTTSEGLQEIPPPDSFEEEEQKLGEANDMLSLFSVEEEDESGISSIAEKLEDIDTSGLLDITKDTLRKMRDR